MKKNLSEKDPWKILYGMFSNWGLIVIASLVTMWINIFTISKLILPLTYLIFTIGFYNPIKNLKNYKLGGVIAFILGETLLLK